MTILFLQPYSLSPLHCSPPLPSHASSAATAAIRTTPPRRDVYRRHTGIVSHHTSCARAPSTSRRHTPQTHVPAKARQSLDSATLKGRGRGAHHHQTLGGPRSGEHVLSRTRSCVCVCGATFLLPRSVRLAPPSEDLY